MQTADEVLQEAAKAHMANDWPRAEYLYCRIIAHAEDHPQAYFMLGTLYAQALATGRAITFLKRALELDPNNYAAMQNLAGAYRQVEDRDKAVAWNEKALAFNRNALLLSNLAGCYINQGEPERALEYADEALALQSDFAEAGNHRALALLEMGRFTEGWKQYEARIGCVGKQDANIMTRSRFTPRPFACPMWKGQKTWKLAIHGEQGLGDEIMFLTCLAQLKDRAREIAIEVNPRLVKLIQNSFPWAKVYGEHKDCPIEPDVYIPLGSLPGLCWPVKKNAYLKPVAEHPRTEKTRIGLSWFGGSQLTHDRLRNTFAADWKTLLTKDAEYISLQYGPRESEAEILGIPHDAEGIADLDRLAAMIKSCDLVVTVCNTTVHLAGALGVPCLVLVPSKPAWRYGMTGEKMVWYESVTMLRQGQDESWPQVLTRAKEWIADFRRIPGIESQAA